LNESGLNVASFIEMMALRDPLESEMLLERTVNKRLEQ
jgi:hypothetical protein